MLTWMPITYFEPMEYRTMRTILVRYMLKSIPLGYAPSVIYLVRSVLHCHFWVALIALVVSGHIVIV